MTVLAGLGFFAVPILLIIGLVAVVRKTGAAKKWFKIAGGIFAASIVIMIIFNEDSDKTVKETATEVKADEEKKQEPSAEEKLREEEEEEKKKVEEKKAKEVEAEKVAAKEAAAKAKEEQSKYADSFINDIGIITEDGLTLADESYDFIVKNYSLFPAVNDEKIEQAKSMADSSITSKHLNKNAQPYFEKLATFQGTVISVEEAPAEVSEAISLTHIMDDDMQSYQVFMYKGTGDILEDDTVRFWGVPVGASSFTNVSGGSTNVQIFLGSHMEKVQ